MLLFEIRNKISKLFELVLFNTASGSESWCQQTSDTFTLRFVHLRVRASELSLYKDGQEGPNILNGAAIVA